MKLLGLLPRVPSRLLWLGALGSFFVGVATTALVAVVNRLTRDDAAGGMMGGAYAGLCVLVLAATLLSNLSMSRFSGSLVSELSILIGRRIVASPLRVVERVGAPRLTSILTTDCVSVAMALGAVANVVTSLFTVGFCLIFLGTLSLPLLGGFVMVSTLGLLLVRRLMRRAAYHEHHARNALFEVVDHLDTVTHGTKELMLHGARREAFFERTLGTALERQRRQAFGQDAFNTGAYTVGNLFFFVSIGLLVFFGRGLVHATGPVVAGFVTVILYMMTPITRIVVLVPMVVRGMIALRGMEEVGLSLEPSTLVVDPTPLTPAPITLRGVTHAYFRERENASFTLGPLELSLSPGTLTFVIGGNGSGKSTLVKVLTGLYAAESGDIVVGSTAVREENREAYRQLFSVVFNDFHLIADLGLLGVADVDARAQGYLAALELDHKVKVENGALSTTELSTGQRKRLALLVAYLEDRPFYVFDEWASDQDPAYKDVFYRRILPELRERGKGVLVVTHDDRYFDLADRVVKLEDGRIVPQLRG